MDPVYPPQSDGAGEIDAVNVTGQSAGHAKATIAEVIANMSGIVDGIQDLRNEVADVKPMGQSLHAEIEQIRSVSRAGGVSDDGSFGQEGNEGDDCRSQGGSVVG
jgi:Retrotransposon gag protein